MRRWKLWFSPEDPLFDIWECVCVCRWLMWGGMDESWWIWNWGVHTTLIHCPHTGRFFFSINSLSLSTLICASFSTAEKSTTLLLERTFCNNYNNFSLHSIRLINVSTPSLLYFYYIHFKTFFSSSREFLLIFFAQFFFSSLLSPSLFSFL